MKDVAWAIGLLSPRNRPAMFRLPSSCPACAWLLRLVLVGKGMRGERVGAARVSHSKEKVLIMASPS
ncbi:hypothetical protein AA15669_1977 [Saccharibacter floricola DSM 15669]|uniref:Uncharacterized protein n=1 Tax=Saccharibacter floricola DSM 15669 TaxID=1123227 RepID=A0ABQ0P194_9PROT|nr:hypothetical protein AA15669_1977 [Saccharibacter floricola DSM 15669]